MEVKPSILSIAPMIQWTDRHWRFLMRQITRETLLYTEMTMDSAILYNKTNLDPFIGYNIGIEEPLALQLGGSNPETLSEAAYIAESFGNFSEINLNCGCPSGRAKHSGFGAKLMKDPHLAKRALYEMNRKLTRTPLTVKCRIGVTGKDSYEDLIHFIQDVREVGVRHVVVHSRICVLNGLSPAQNRTIPPLKHDICHALVNEFPDMTFTINGGIRSFEEAKDHLAIQFGRVVCAPIVIPPLPIDGHTATEAKAEIEGEIEGEIEVKGRGKQLTESESETKGFKDSDHLPPHQLRESATNDGDDKSDTCECVGHLTLEGKGGDSIQGKGDTSTQDSIFDTSLATGIIDFPNKIFPSQQTYSNAPFSLFPTISTSRINTYTVENYPYLHPLLPNRYYSIAFEPTSELESPSSSSSWCRLPLPPVHGVMIGRAAYRQPLLFATADSEFFAKPNPLVGITRRELIERYQDYCTRCQEDNIFGSQLCTLIKPLHNFMHGWTGSVEEGNSEPGTDVKFGESLYKHKLDEILKRPRLKAQVDAGEISFGEVLREVIEESVHPSFLDSPILNE